MASRSSGPRTSLADHDWNVTQTAHDLDLTRAHVHNLIRAFGLTRTPSS
jgi:transcriptional regulator of acetoin/glycerol metabolism